MTGRNGMTKYGKSVGGKVPVHGAGTNTDGKKKKKKKNNPHNRGY